MKIEVVKVEHLEFQAVDVLHIYPHNRKQIHAYRRYNKPDHWCSFLGNHSGWSQVFDPTILEEAYQSYLLKENRERRGKQNESK